jgi:hypothetical protein
LKVALGRKSKNILARSMSTVNISTAICASIYCCLNFRLNCLHDVVCGAELASLEIEYGMDVDFNAHQTLETAFPEAHFY